MFKYGERLYTDYYYNRAVSSWIANSSFRFRKDPVPYKGKKLWRFHCWYKTGAMRKRERSLYYEHKEYVRNARAPWNLPDPWDDIIRSHCRELRSWKNKKIKRQWAKNL